ncbi:MAG TPA: DUF6159 family protein [Steroidobacteraceae bacterium]|jgi:uncharacterized protein DUF6159|nr:DUF6159 family protein [Steroidobacteraceae bacterium]
MFTRFSRSWALIKASGAVLRQDKELLLFPFFSAIATLLVFASFIVPLVVTGAFEQMNLDESQAPFMVFAFIFYLIQYFIIFFFNSALVGAAMIRLDGGDPTVRDGLRIASSRIVQIIGYAAIAATVGLILRLIEERLGIIGRWITGLLGIAFTIATFLTVPILVSRDIGPVEAVKESAVLLKKTWGENIIGNAGMGVVFFLFYLGAIGIGMLFIFTVVQTGNAPLIILVSAIVALAVIALALVQAALQGVYSAALYRYATDGNVGESFSSALLGEAFRRKG